MCFSSTNYNRFNNNSYHCLVSVCEMIFFYSSSCQWFVNAGTSYKLIHILSYRSQRIVNDRLRAAGDGERSLSVCEIFSFICSLSVFRRCAIWPTLVFSYGQPIWRRKKIIFHNPTKQKSRCPHTQKKRRRPPSAVWHFNRLDAISISKRRMR